MGKLAKLSCIAITQQLEKQYFKRWFDNELEIIDKTRLSDDITPFLEIVQNKLSDYDIESFYGILHNKDFIKRDDDTIEMKAVHVHIVIKFKDKADTLSNLAYKIGVESQYIEKAKTGRFGFDNMLSYLVHAKYKDKYQYKAEDVVTLKGRSYLDIYKERFTEWDKGASVIKKQKAKLSIDYLEDLILQGFVTRSQVYLTDEYFEVYSRYRTRCDEAFETFAERKTYEAIESLNRGDFKLSAFYISGASGTGKTRFANALIKHLINNNDGWSCYSTASNNPMDDYRGEEIILMDDLRGSAMTASDWLKLLDPYNSSPASARYRNKQVACRVIIITSVKDVLEFFYYCKQINGGDRSEALDQFLRRIQSIIEVIEYKDDIDSRLNLYSVSEKSDLTRAELRDAKREIMLKYENGIMRDDIENMRFTINREDDVYDGASIIKKILKDVDKNNNLNNEFYDLISD